MTIVKDKPMTSSERKKRHEEKRKAKGYKEVHIWVPSEEHAEEIKKIAFNMRK